MNTNEPESMETKTFGAPQGRCNTGMKQQRFIASGGTPNAIGETRVPHFTNSCLFVFIRGFRQQKRLGPVRARRWASTAFSVNARKWWSCSSPSTCQQVKLKTAGLANLK